MTRGGTAANWGRAVTWAQSSAKAQTGLTGPSMSNQLPCTCFAPEPRTPRHTIRKALWLADRVCSRYFMGCVGLAALVSRVWSQRAYSETQASIVEARRVDKLSLGLLRFRPSFSARLGEHSLSSCLWSDGGVASRRSGFQDAREQVGPPANTNYNMARSACKIVEFAEPFATRRRNSQPLLRTKLLNTCYTWASGRQIPNKRVDVSHCANYGQL